MEKPIHPAEILSNFIGDNKDISIEKASQLFQCSKKTIEDILSYDPEKSHNRGISKELGKRISYVFNNSEEFWNNLQKTYNLYQELKKDDIEAVMKFNDDDIEFIKLVIKVKQKNDECPHPAEIIQYLVGDDKKYNKTEASLITGIPRQTLSDFLQFNKKRKNNVSISSNMSIKLGQALDINYFKFIEMQGDYNQKIQSENNDIDKKLLEKVKKMEANILNEYKMNITKETFKPKKHKI